MKYIGLIKNSTSHSLSPILFKSVFKDLKLDYRHAVLNVRELDLNSTLNFLKNDFFLGANVTIPHKENILKFLDWISEEAKIIGAVNTIVNKEGKLFGYNTDVFGIQSSLEKYSDEIKNKSVLILGAGGAARAVVYTLIKYFDVAEVKIYNRTIDRTQKLINDFQNLTNKISVASELKNNSEKLIINTTSIGMVPKINEMPIPSEFSFLENQIVFDVIYNPIETEFLKKARLANAVTINGLVMFITQAEKSFEIWTGKKIKKDVILNDLIKVLKK